MSHQTRCLGMNSFAWLSFEQNTLSPFYSPCAFFTGTALSYPGSSNIDFAEPERSAVHYGREAFFANEPGGYMHDARNREWSTHDPGVKTVLALTHENHSIISPQYQSIQIQTSLLIQKKYKYFKQKNAYEIILFGMDVPIRIYVRIIIDRRHHGEAQPCKLQKRLSRDSSMRLRSLPC